MFNSANGYRFWFMLQRCTVGFRWRLDGYGCSAFFRCFGLGSWLDSSRRKVECPFVPFAIGVINTGNAGGLKYFQPQETTNALPAIFRLGCRIGIAEGVKVPLIESDSIITNFRGVSVAFGPKPGRSEG